MPQLLDYLRHHCDDKDVADEAFSQALFKALIWIDTREAAKMTSTHRQAYLLCTARHEANNISRKGRRGVHGNAIPLQPDHLPSKPLTEDPCQAASDAELRALLERCLAELSGEEREMLKLRYDEELTFAKIAELKGRTVRVVRGWVSAADRRLRDLINRRLRGDGENS